MNCMENIGVIISSVGALISVVFTIIISVKKKKIDKELETHKSELQTIVQKQQIQFSKLHQERAKVIKEIHGKLIELQDAVLDYHNLVVRPIEEADKKEEKERLRKERLYKALVGYHDYVISNSFYFEKTLFEKLRKFSNDLNYKNWHAQFLKDQFKEDDRTLREQYREDWQQIQLSFLNELPKVIEDLEDEFRELLGVKSE